MPANESLVHKLRKDADNGWKKMEKEALREKRVRSALLRGKQTVGQKAMNKAKDKATAVRDKRKRSKK